MTTSQSVRVLVACSCCAFALALTSMSSCTPVANGADGGTDSGFNNNHNPVDSGNNTPVDAGNNTPVDAGPMGIPDGGGQPGDMCAQNSDCLADLCLTAEGECSGAECMVTVPAPSMGSCVTVAAGVTDAGVDDAGNAAQTVCNPITNAGCATGYVCNPDYSGNNYFCWPGGTGAQGNLAACGDCTAQDAYCGVGGLCLGLDQNGNAYQCFQMCCTNADCGSTGNCNTMILSSPLGSGVGLCVPN